MRRQLLTIGPGGTSEKNRRSVSLTKEEEESLTEEDEQEIECEVPSNLHPDKKAFMSTAPINFPGHSRAKPKIKESKEELKHYSHKLEEALSTLKQRYLELEKDHEVLNKTYMRELKKGDAV